MFSLKTENFYLSFMHFVVFIDFREESDRNAFTLGAPTMSCTYIKKKKTRTTKFLKKILT